jgi:hypothetical protein
MRKLAQLAVIVAASVLTIMSAVGGADLLGTSPRGRPAVHRQRDGSMPAASGPAPGRPAPASDCLHWWGAEDRRSSVPASASTPHQRAALTARQRYCASTAYRCQPTTLTVAGTRATLTK